MVSVFSTHRLNNRVSLKEDEEHEEIKGPAPFQFDVAMMIEQSRPVSELFLSCELSKIAIICVTQ